MSPQYDGEGNLIYDGVYYYIYDFKNRLSEVYKLAESAQQSSTSSLSSGTTSTSGRQAVQQTFDASLQDLERGRREIYQQAGGCLLDLLPSECCGTRVIESCRSRVSGSRGRPAPQSTGRPAERQLLRAKRWWSTPSSLSMATTRSTGACCASPMARMCGTPTMVGASSRSSMSTRRAQICGHARRRGSGGLVSMSCC